MIPRSPSDLHECSATRASTLPPLLRALWHDAHGDWNRAHSIAQDIESPDAAWVHAYLHRKEGDLANAGYWYRQAGKQRPSVSLAEEWTELVNYFLRGQA